MSREVDADILGMDGEDMVDEIMTLRERVKELEAYNQVLLESQGQFRSDLQAAKIEGLCRAKEIMHVVIPHGGVFFRQLVEEVIKGIDAEIAAFERGDKP